MTLEEIKQIPMSDIVQRYGFRPNKAGFIHCPFHKGDKGASMKIYQNDAHCFGCGWNGDAIDFVAALNGLSFKEAFIALGGTYEAEDKAEIRRRIALAEQKRREKAEREEADRRAMIALCDKIQLYESLMQGARPFGGLWCYLANRLPVLIGEWEERFEKMGRRGND